jgi:hypothetical protein
MLMVEEFLDGDEMTVTLMPPASPRPDGSRAPTHWALPPVYRFDQRGGVAPYNGDVPVTANSIAISPGRLRDPAIVAMIDSCVSAAALVDPDRLPRRSSWSVQIVRPQHEAQHDGAGPPGPRRSGLPLGDRRPCRRLELRRSLAGDACCQMEVRAARGA